MILPLILSLVSPEPVDEYPEPPSPCVVSWAETIGTRFAEGTTPRIERRCRELVDALDETFPPESIRVEVGGETAAFTVHVALLEGAEVVFEQEADGEVCECGGNDLTAFAMKRVAATIEAREEPQEALFEPDPIETEPMETTPSETEPEPKRIGPLGIAGSVTMGLGLGGVIVGAVLLPRPNESDPIESSFLTLDRTNYRTPAIVALGLGSAAVLGGTAMLVTDLVRRKKQRQKSATVVTPVVTQEAAWLSISGRF